MTRTYPTKPETVYFFGTCLVDLFYPKAGVAGIELIKREGVKVIFPQGQSCCGQPAFNSGYIKEVIPLANHFLKLFKSYDYIVAPSGSCVSMVRVHYEDLPLDKPAKDILKDLKNRIFEFCEFLVNVLNVHNLGGQFAHRVTYHDSCHLSRELKIREEPRKLIRAIQDIQYVEMNESDLCCGFGGTFSYKFKELSIEMVERKAQCIIKSGAEFCIGADSSCLMNISGYLKKQGHTIQTMHIADLLAESLKR